MARSSKKYWVWATLIALLLAIPFVVLILIGSGSKSGEEFSPDDFSRRSFSYNRLPWLGWVLWNKHYTDLTGGLERNLISSGLITPVTNDPQVWHLCDDFSDSPSEIVVPVEHDARFLIGYLDLESSNGGSYWDEWNADHPKIATVLWPIVADLARKNRYLVIPDLMRTAMAMESDEVAEFNRLVANLKLNESDDDLSRP